MKKLMIAAMMVLGTSSAFAADSDALKAITSQKDYAQAAQLLQSTLSQLANAQEKAKAYNHLTKLALDKFDKENAVQAANMQAQLTKQAEQPYDTVGFYNAAYNAVINGVECAKYDAQPDEKGKVKPKFTSSLSSKVANARMQLVTAGNAAAQKNNEADVLKYWGTFLDTDDNPMFAGTKEQEAQFLGQVAYFTAMYAGQAQKYDLADKYVDIAIANPDPNDPKAVENAQNFKYAIAKQGLKTTADSVAYAAKLQQRFDADVKSDMIFSNLCDILSGLKKDAELDAVIAKKTTADASSYLGWAYKGQTLMNRNSGSDNANWDECIEAFKKACTLDETNALVLTYLGFSINAKAAQAANGAEQKALLQDSMTWLEKAKAADPTRDKANWAYPLYQCYYTVYGGEDARTKELEALMK